MKGSHNRGGQPASHSLASWIGAALLSTIVVATNLCGQSGSGARMWGAHSYRYLPAVALPVGLALLFLVALGLLGLRGLPRVVVMFVGRLDDARGTSVRRAVVLISGIAAPAFFWRYREAHVFLGDGSPLVTDLPRGQVFHPHEPLTMYTHHLIYGALRGSFSAGGLTLEQVARDTVALSSCLLGGVFVLLTALLASELLRSADGENAVPSSGRGLSMLLIWALLVSQGAVQIFFGYVENYGFVTCAIVAFLVLLLRTLRAPATLPVAAGLLALAIAFDLSAFVLLPALLLAGALVSRKRGGIRWALGALVVLPVVLLILQRILNLGGSPFRFTDSLQEIVQTAVRGHGEAGRLAALVTPGHLWDTFNEQLLLGPLAGLALLIGSVLAFRSRRRLGPSTWLLLAAAASVLAGVLVTGDLNLGYARDWDLFAPFGVVLTAATLTLWRPHCAGHRILMLLLAVTLFQTVPWILLNSSFDRSFERMKHLPLGYGRGQVVVGSWYLRHSELEQARQWFRAALREYPDNAPAHYALGQLALDRADVRGAKLEFAAAVASRPDKADYRLALADALTLDSDLPNAIAQIYELIRRDPTQPAYWGACAITLEGMHRDQQARLAIGHAISLAPSDTLYTGLCDALSGENGYTRGMLGYWMRLVQP